MNLTKNADHIEIPASLREAEAEMQKAHEAMCAARGAYIALLEHAAEAARRYQQEHDAIYETARQAIDRGFAGQKTYGQIMGEHGNVLFAKVR